MVARRHFAQPSALLPPVLLLILLLFCGQTQAREDRRVLVLVDDSSPGMYPDNRWWEKTSRGIAQGEKDFELTAEIHIDAAMQTPIQPDFSLEGVNAAILSITDAAPYDSLIARINNQRIPIISFHANNTRLSARINSLLHIANSNYTLGIKTGERASLLGRLTYACLYSNPREVYTTICKGVHFGLSKHLQGERVVVLPKQHKAAGQAVIEQLDIEQVRLLISLDTHAAQTIERVLAQRKSRPSEIFHISMAHHPDMLDWVEEERVNFAFYHQPWLEGYLAMAAAAIAARRLLHDPVDVIVGIRTNKKLQKRLDEYAFVVHYENLGLRTAPGFIDRRNISRVQPLWGVIW